MCTRYVSPEQREIEEYWRIGAGSGKTWDRGLFPLSKGPFIRRDLGGARELVVGQWGMIPPDSETRTPMSKPRGPGDKPKRLSTENARSGSMTSRPTYRDAWKRGQRCIIPAASFDEPNWESTKNVWWRFRRADGAPWGLAGLWNAWTDPQTGEIWGSYTMLTMNANSHPLMSRMHKPELDPVTKKPLPADKQDKRSVIAIEAEDFDQWLAGTTEEARALLQLSPVETFYAGPATS